jgi:ABC-type phosphate transport system substrate-binding protein
MKKTSTAYVLAALAGVSALTVSSRADAANPPCNGYTNPVYMAGSSAAQPLLQQLAVAIGSSISIIYQAPSSCQGVNDLTGPSNPQDSSSANFLDPNNSGTPTACDPTNGGTTPLGLYVDIGVSDVYPATCNAFSAVPLPGSGQKEFHGPIQAMTIAVPSTSTQTSISAEAAYVLFGWAGQSGNTVAPWTDPTQMFIRKPTSGTESMIGWAIGLPPSKWLAPSPNEGGLPQQLGGSGAVVTALKGATNAETAVGILATEYVDQNRGTLKALAFQAKDPHTSGDQFCGYLPDSSSTAFDKLNVRQGRYAIWGPLHFVVNVDGSGNPQPNPNNTGSAASAVQRVIDFVSANGLSTADNTSLIKAAQKAYVIPDCAMEVMTTTEIGAEASYAPTGACGCYYESLAQGGSTTSSYCQTCGSDSDCADAGVYKHCNYGYCEAQ